ncbi:maleylpyruvate isomerase family mycothiol-dependent enzyme [Nocardia sp. NPDC059240]|uniref:maleylpyruvate isomerase family mycothiol-dependent enzyme n=1 Tax=Nocardia sp. NPDC059240 TaxID=3346786 RepID=UPI00369F1E3E
MPTTEPLTPQQIWHAVDTERASLHELLSTLTEAEWNHRSLCESWRVREVVAHIILSSNPSLPTILVGLLRARGDLHTMIRDTAIRHAAKTPTAQLLSQLRATVGLRVTALGTTPTDRLMDLLVHGQDIAIPLGLPREMPAAATRAALDRVWKDGDWRTREAPLPELLLQATGRRTS